MDPSRMENYYRWIRSKYKPIRDGSIPNGISLGMDPSLIRLRWESIRDGSIPSWNPLGMEQSQI